MLTLQMLSWDAIQHRLRAGLNRCDIVDRTATVPTTAAVEKCLSYLCQLAVRPINQFYSKHLSEKQHIMTQQPTNL